MDFRNAEVLGQLGGVAELAAVCWPHVPCFYASYSESSPRAWPRFGSEDPGGFVAGLESGLGVDREFYVIIHGINKKVNTK